MVRKGFLLSGLLAMVTCTHRSTQPPTPTPIPEVAVACVVTDGLTGLRLDGAICTIEGQSAPTSADGMAMFIVHDRPQDLSVTKDGYQPYLGHYDQVANRNLFVTLLPLPPPVPTRDQVLAIQTHDMQGLICHTDQFGDLHWWGAALAWLSAADRQRVYACKRAVGDTHAILQLPTGLPLYDECCNEYSPDRFPALDWSRGETAFDRRLADLVLEIRRAGFIPLIFPDERVDHSLTDIQLALDALEHSPYGDLRFHALYMTGWDGVFYGWPEDRIGRWAATLRTSCPLCVLGLEFNTGHIPQEAGIDMSGYDALFIEFEESVHTPNNWCIVPRLIGWDRFRPPADYGCADYGGGPLPRMRMDTPRGEIQTVCWEWKTYAFVRGRVSVDAVADDRRYLIEEGCPAIG